MASPHHVLPQTKGGSDDPENLLDVCANCHDRIHKGRPAEARSLGLLKSAPGVA